MWIGGVRVIIPDEEGRVLMVKQVHEGRDLWLVPGGGIEAGENSKEAAVREVREETGLEVKIKRLIWHVEEVSEERGQRFVNFFLAELGGGTLGLGKDPEFDEDHQVLREVKFLSKKEIMSLERVYPDLLKNELWEALEPKYYNHAVYRIR
jgi:8-oxo-dGTP diphosphatase